VYDLAFLVPLAWLLTLTSRTAPSSAHREGDGGSGTGPK
jgi:hypothetical protein